ncbi:MAG: hypothetical protein EOP53_19810, partial [Sphingobacteriales bacterium]
FLLEAFSAAGIYAFSMNLLEVAHGGNKVFYAVFHGISIFCHSGFTLLRGNFSDPVTNHAYIFQLILMGIMVLGGLGFASFFDITSIKRLRQRLLQPEINWTLQTRISVFGTMATIFFASILFYFCERNGVLANLKIVETGITILFNSAGWFGSGFYAVSPANFSAFLQYCIMFFMLIGSSSGTFSVLGFGLYFYVSKSFSSNQNPYKLLAKNALAILFYALVIILSGTVISFFYNGEFDFRIHLFHAVSAFTNTGLSNISHENYFLQSPVFYILMLLGRIGVPVVSIWFLRKNSEEKIPDLPEVMLI